MIFSNDPERCPAHYANTTSAHMLLHNGYAGEKSRFRDSARYIDVDVHTEFRAISNCKKYMKVFNVGISEFITTITSPHPPGCFLIIFLKSSKKEEEGTKVNRVKRRRVRVESGEE